MKQFNDLPKEIQDDIKSTLRAYDDIDVWYENGRYTFGTCIKSHYSPDHEYIGTFYAKDIYSDDERILNYCEEFHSYPHDYKGNRDYALIRDYTAKYKIVDGNVVRA